MERILRNIMKIGVEKFLEDLASVIDKVDEPGSKWFIEPSQDRIIVLDGEGKLVDVHELDWSKWGLPEDRDLTPEQLKAFLGHGNKLD